MENLYWDGRAKNYPLEKFFEQLNKAYTLVAFSFEEFLFSSFSLPFGPYFPCSCSYRKTRKHDSEHIPPIPALAEARMAAKQPGRMYQFYY